MHRSNWDDLQFVLAVVDAQSVAGAARRLGVNHATVLRRIAAFEKRVGTQVFQRSPQGYAVRPDRLRLIAAMHEVGHAMASVEQLARGLEAPLSGRVRITSTDTLCQCLLPDILLDLRHQAPDLKLSLIASNAHLDLARLEAEITLRPALELPEALTGETPVNMRFATYCAIGSEPAGWLGLDGTLRRSRPNFWLERNVGKQGMTVSADSFLVHRELAAKGIGKAVLPCFIAQSDPRLRLVQSDQPDDLMVPLWVACHEELATVPRLHRVRRLLYDALSRSEDLLAGQI